MKRLALLPLLIAVGCGSSEPRPRETTRNTSVERWEQDQESAQTIGNCKRCNMTVYEGHRCRHTVPCALCKREHGSRHFHEIVRKCSEDGWVMRENHICNDAKTCEKCLHASNGWKRCELCRTEKHKGLLSKGCERCYRQAPIVAVRGITSYCGTCDQESGTNHIHGKTKFCPTCSREAGKGHVHDVTRLCMTHQRECAVDHTHGKTEYCQACRRDVGSNHKHHETVWCYRCDREAPWPHCHHTDEF